MCRYLCVKIDISCRKLHQGSCFYWGRICVDWGRENSVESSKNQYDDKWSCSLSQNTCVLLTPVTYGCRANLAREDYSIDFSLINTFTQRRWRAPKQDIVINAHQYSTSARQCSGSFCATHEIPRRMMFTFLLSHFGKGNHADATQNNCADDKAKSFTWEKFMPIFVPMTPRVGWQGLQNFRGKVWKTHLPQHRGRLRTPGGCSLPEGSSPGSPSGIHRKWTAAGTGSARPWRSRTPRPPAFSLRCTWPAPEAKGNNSTKT